MWRRWWHTVGAVSVLGLLVAAVAGATGLGAVDQSSPAAPPRTHHKPTHESSQSEPYRAFSADSWWNTPLPDEAPIDPNDQAVLHYLRTAPQSGNGCLNLAGTAGSPWGQPIYWAKPSDPQYDVQGVVAAGRPPELDDIRIPVNARAASNSDNTMTIFDRSAGYVTALTGAQYDARKDRWTASGATVTYVHSNGLNVLTGLSDNAHNIGTHRGNNGATMAVRWDMVQAGAITNVLKVASGPELANRWVFPLVGSDGGYNGSDPAVPPEGLRLRVKPSVNLNKLHLEPQAAIIARALKKYGIYLGDSGRLTALKLEDTVTEGMGEVWDLKPADLCALPFTPKYWDVVKAGYDPSRDN
jgi:hypothetical protein